MRWLIQEWERRSTLAGPFMAEPSYRLGDLIDDYCMRCRLVLNHAVASMVGDQVVKVICQTCYSEHAYQHGKVVKKKPGGRTTLFDQVLAKVAPSETADPPAAPAKRKAAAPARTISRRKSKPGSGD
jgi:hypothetical protein